MNEDYKKREAKRRHKMANVRVRGRRGSDGMIGVVIPFEDYHEDIEKQIEKKKNQCDDNKIDFPITKDRLYYSFIWDRFTFYDADNDQDIIRIDPTDKKLNMQ
jgi:hypothetical protein